MSTKARQTATALLGPPGVGDYCRLIRKAHKGRPKLVGLPLYITGYVAGTGERAVIVTYVAQPHTNDLCRDRVWLSDLERIPPRSPMMVLPRAVRVM